MHNHCNKFRFVFVLMIQISFLMITTLQVALNTIIRSLRDWRTFKKKLPILLLKLAAT